MASKGENYGAGSHHTGYSHRIIPLTTVSDYRLHNYVVSTADVILYYIL
jgi:hypothetical protein